MNFTGHNDSILSTLDAVLCLSTSLTRFSLARSPRMLTSGTVPPTTFGDSEKSRTPTLNALTRTFYAFSLIQGLAGWPFASTVRTPTLLSPLHPGTSRHILMVLQPVASSEMPTILLIDLDDVSLFLFDCDLEEAIEPPNEAWEICIREEENLRCFRCEYF